MENKYKIYKAIYSFLSLVLPIASLCILFYGLKPEQQQKVLSDYPYFFVVAAIVIAIFAGLYLLFPYVFTVVNWIKFRLFKGKSTLILVHELIHMCRREIFLEYPVSDAFLKRYLDSLVNGCLKKISRGFCVTLKVLDDNEKGNIKTIKCPDRDKRSKLKYTYDNEVQENPFLSLIFSDCYVLMASRLKRNILNQFVMVGDKLIKQTEEVKDKIPPEALTKCLKEYNSVCNYPVKTSLNEQTRTNISRKYKGAPDKVPRNAVWAVLTIDHHLPYVSYYIGKRLARSFQQYSKYFSSRQ